MVDTDVRPACRSCGRVDPQFTTVSEHRTAAGTISYLRCTCGNLQVVSRSRLDNAERVVIGTPPTPTTSVA